MKIKGITIDLGVNTKPLTEGFQQVNKELNQTDKTLRDINKGLKLDPNSAELLEQKTKYLNKAIEETNKKLDEEKKILGELEKLDGGTGKYEQQIDALKRQIVDTTGKQKAYQSELDNVGQTTNEVANETKSLEGSLLNANLKTELITGAVHMAGEAFKALVGFVKEAITASAEYADNILTQATVTGLSTDALQEYAYMSELVDVSVDTITGSMTKLEKSMYSAQQGSKSATTAFDSLGISVTNSDGSLRDMDTVFGEALDALGQMSNETERDALAMQIFGKSAKDLNPLIEAGSESIDKFREEAYQMGYVLDETSLNSLGGMDDAFQRLDTMVTTLKNQIGLALAPVITDIANKFMEWAKSVDWEAVRAQIGAFVEGVIQFIQFLSPIISGVVQGIIFAFQSVWNIIQGLWNFFSTAWNGIVEIITGVKDALQPIIETIVGFFQNIWDKVETVIEKVKEFTSWIGGIGDAVGGFFAGVGNFLTGGGQVVASGGFASGGISMNTTINVNNNGAGITQAQVLSWADVMTNRINENLGRMV